MWNTFKAEIKHILKNKWRVAGLILLLFIPFTYGFLYMNAYWAPFSHVDRLKIAVVSKDDRNNDLTNSLINGLTKEGAISGSSNQIYDIVEDEKIIDDPHGAVDSGEYSAVIIIPNGFDAAMKQFGLDVIGGDTITDALEKATKSMLAVSIASGEKEDIDRVSFYFSYKYSYLGGEMANFASTNTTLVLLSMFPSLTNSGLASTLIHKLEDMAHNDGGNIVKVERYGNESFNSYGTGLAPYFISIALWAGALATLFVVKNERHTKKESTFKHLVGKLMMWISIGWIQSLILITAITIQGVNIGIKNQWELYAYGLFMATLFPTIVMSIAYTMRFGDLGEFLVVILLIMQLISSSGTFPVEMQNIIFKIIHPIAPFTYTINSIREIMWDTDVAKLFINIMILIIFPIILFPLTFLINYRFDKKTAKKIKGNKIYESFEIHLGDY